MALVAFLTRAGRPVAFKTRSRNPLAADRIGEYRGHAIYVGPGGISVEAPSLKLRGYSSSKPLMRAIDKALAAKEAKKANPSARQRRRSEIKHRVAQAGLQDARMFRGEKAAMVRERRAVKSGIGRKQQRTLKQQRRMGSKMLASGLVAKL